MVFIDDVLIYSAIWQEHLEHINAVFLALQQHQLHVKLTKCPFAKQELNYLGHVISSSGVSTDPKKIKIIDDWLAPQCVKDLRSFLGMAGYYRKYVKNFGLISKPLTNLLKKGEVYVWTSEAEASFQALKNNLISALVLALPDFTKTFELETNASDKGIGTVLQ